MRLPLVITAICALTGCYNEAIPLRDLATRQTTTTGQIKARDCANHGAVYYKFEVDGKPQAGRAPPGLLDCHRIHVGDTVKVYYDPKNPAQHTLLEPQRLYEQERGFYIPIWIGVPLLFVALLVFQYFSVRLRETETKPKPKPKPKPPK